MSSNIDKSRNDSIITITHFLKNTPVFVKHSLYLYDLYYTETQSNILIIVILLQPEQENDISTLAPAGQKPPELRQFSGPPMHTALLVRLSRVHLSPLPHHHPYAPNARHATDFTFDQPNLSPPPHHHPYAPIATHATDFTFDQPNLSPQPHHHPYAPNARHATEFTFDQPNLSPPPHHHPYAPTAPHVTDFTFDIMILFLAILFVFTAVKILVIFQDGRLPSTAGHSLRHGCLTASDRR